MRKIAFLLLFFATTLLSENVILMRSESNNGGVRTSTEYRVTTEQALAFTTGPLEESLPVTFEETMKIAARSLSEKWPEDQIEVNRGGLTLGGIGTQFYYWLFRFKVISAEDKRISYHRVVLLPDGTLIEPIVKRFGEETQDDPDNPITRPKNSKNH